MSRDAYRGPRLPRSLLEQVESGSNSRAGAKNVSRKDRRKIERHQKKAVRTNGRHSTQRNRGLQNGRTDEWDESDEEDTREAVAGGPTSESKKPVREAARPLKSILKKPVDPRESESSLERSPVLDTPKLSRAVKSKLAEDDTEIAALEKKLGIKGKKSKALETDGLDWVAGGSESGSDGELANSLKRKTSEDAKWLQQKRLKIETLDAPTDGPEGAVRDSDLSESDSFEYDDDGFGSVDGVGSSEEIDEVGSDFEGDLDEAAATTPKRQRENPYIAPVSKDTAPGAKYIPPSLRQASTSDEEALRQLRRQIQGLLNRLSEANLVSIIQSLEEIYMKHLRQHVTSVLVDRLVVLISDPSTLNDTFLILHAGFAAAVYKAVGADFGAHLLEKLVEAFDYHRESNHAEGKQTLNVLAYLSCLYTFKVVGSSLMFDYIRLLLEELSENNTELLLRVIRTSGQQLRQDDPTALKDIVLLLQRSAASIGEDQLSVRTKFMMETINDLKNNRMRGGAAASAVATEHTARMKKVVGSLGNSHSAKATEPLRITLSDIRDSDKKGKWWLVGASYLDPVKLEVNDGISKQHATREARTKDAGYESDTPGSVDLNKLARKQGMNTDVRRAIFVTILSSSDHKEAHLRLLKLRLKSKQMLEIPRVIVHCVGAEKTYNPFYAALAYQICGEHALRKAFQFTLWDSVRAIDEEDEIIGKMSMRKMVNIAKLYGSVLTSGGLDIKMLKKVDFSDLSEQMSMFLEVLLVTLFVQLRKDDAISFKKAVTNVFARSAGVDGLPQGLQLFLNTVMKSTGLTNSKKEKKLVVDGSLIAIEALTRAARAAPIAEDDEEEGRE